MKQSFLRIRETLTGWMRHDKRNFIDAIVIGLTLIGVIIVTILSFVGVMK